MRLSEFWNVISIIIHFSERSRNLNFTDEFLKCENYHNRKKRSL
ncbi:hypothetical protein LEP1GSC021_1523 [Leptospira noguchii str. 1993005606]|uniref:Uncharacterized protein n=2 Tax=Leptospira noguchii TaxID=28182 RepID=M6YUI5_9LEPT|nr:hypothetical protein LEP1GSC035_4656 [Leptospira noguchii str. 2007001578]EMO90013.1 hypothetical protein LEP1GSC024_1828 [Leptospira noguchii str. 2001034031]EPE83112.1 hypothetical protein LEP1GSC021_1523 [Leptospira noguchii str. 1993005606]